MTTPIGKNNRKNNLIFENAAKIVMEDYDGDLGLLPAIIKSTLHDGVMRSLQQANMLQMMVFHGGTCLQRVYGSPRLSEDLDFCLMPGMDPCADFKAMCQQFELCLREDFAKEYNIDQRDIFYRYPKNDPATANAGEVFTWRIAIQIQLGVARQLIKVDLENRNAMTAEIAKFGPVSRTGLCGYADIYLNAESSGEIMANKFMAIFLRNRLQYRDCFDLGHFCKTISDIDLDLLLRKIRSLFKADDWLGKMASRMFLLEDQDRFLQGLTAELSRFVQKDKLPTVISHDFARHTLQLVAKAADVVRQELSS